jgi:hypothetical protein
MNVAEKLLALCNEFYAAVTPREQKRNQGLNLLLRKVKKNIEYGLEGFSDEQELKLVKETIGDLRELMNQISKEERERNPKLKKLYSEIRESLLELREELKAGYEDEPAQWPEQVSFNPDYSNDSNENDEKEFAEVKDNFDVEDDDCEDEEDEIACDDYENYEDHTNEDEEDQWD